MRTILIMLFMAGAFAGRAQEAHSLSISFDKTIHVLFASEVKYYDKGDERIAASVSSDAPKVLRIKANEESFEGESNLNAVTGDGRYYTFNVGYLQNPAYSLYQVNENGSLDGLLSEPVEVNDRKSLLLIFGEAIRYVDYGNNESLSVTQAEGVENILRVQARDAGMYDSNITVMTASGRFHSFDALYREEVRTTTRRIGTPAGKAETDAGVLFDNRLNERELDRYCTRMNDRPRHLYHCGVSAHRIEVSMDKLFVKDNLLFMAFTISNRSSLEYPVEFFKLVVKDRKIRKNTSVQEDEHTPLYRQGYSELIKGNGTVRFVIVLEKFTITDTKMLEVLLFERNGGRHIRFEIDNATLFKAKPF